MGPTGLIFGLACAAVYWVAARFSTRHNRNVAAYAVIMWGATKVWNYKSGTDAQIYLDTVLALGCGLLCIAVMFRDRRSRWPLAVLALMVAWEFLNAIHSEPGHYYGPEFDWWCQVIANILFALALFVLAMPGGCHGALVAFRSIGVNFIHRSRRPAGVGWGRDAPDAACKRQYPGRRP